MRRRIGDGEIVDGQGQAVHYYTPYRPQQWLWYYRRAENEVAVPFAMPILYADDYLVAVDKPHFLPSIPSGQYLEHTAVARVRKHFNNYDITPLHRLRSEERRVGKECRSRWAQDHYKEQVERESSERNRNSTHST